MKKKLRESFQCSSCEARFPQWYGRCPQCQEWNTLEAVVESITPTGPATAPRGSARPLSEISATEVLQKESLNLDFLDRVLGGGLPRSAVVLVAGEPGIGKSTLLFQMAAHLKNQTCLYVSAEESVGQLNSRFRQLGKENAENIFVMSENRLPVILSEIQKIKPHHVVIDSIQMMYGDSPERIKGGQAAIREVSEDLVSYAKAYNVTLWIVGHVTKEGEIAGPRSLEHLVDSVLFFSSANEPDIRLLQTGKHRFGQSGELVLLEMTEKGLVEKEGVDEFWMQARDKSVSGCALASVMLGSRCYCIEIQALCVPSFFPSPRRSTSGFDYNRLLLILAVLERRLKLSFSQDDVYLKVVGGLKIQDPAADLAVAAALVSAKTEMPVNLDQVFCGELGLTGELRPVPQIRDRLKAAARIGKSQMRCGPYSKKALASREIDVASSYSLSESLAPLLSPASNAAS